MREKQPQVVQKAAEKTPGKIGKIVGWVFILGVFLVLHTIILAQKDLEKPLAPLHLALVGLLGAFLYGAWETGVSRYSLALIAIGSGCLSLGFGRPSADVGVVVLAAGWPLMIFWCWRDAFRGGLR